MVSYHLAATGLNTAALDLSPALFDDRAEAAGVEFIQGDAAALPVDDRRFDLVFSYNSFEHLHDPAQALSEMIRVVRPGGTIHLDFGPLYLSAYGLHAYRSVLVPFCHLLFEREALQDYVERRGLEPIPFETLNGWSLQQFRALWEQSKGRIRTVAYREVPQLAGKDLIEQYPSCFRATTAHFDDLLVGSIQSTFRRTA